MDKVANVYEKMRYAFSLLDSSEWIVLLVLVAAYHVLVFLIFFIAVRGSALVRIRALQFELKEAQRQEGLREASWKDREEELRRVLGIEKDREISQIRAEYDSYVSLLEQKLMRSRSGPA